MLTSLEKAVNISKSSDITLKVQVDSAKSEGLFTPRNSLALLCNIIIQHNCNCNYPGIILKEESPHGESY